MEIAYVFEVILLSFALLEKIKFRKPDEPATQSANPENPPNNLHSDENLVASLEKNMESAASKLRESEERYRHLVEFSPDGIAVHRDGILLFINKCAMKIMKIENKEQVIGKPISNFIHPDYAETVRSRLEAVGKNLGTILPPQEEKYIRLDGVPIDVEVSTSSFIYESKMSFLTIFREITNRKKIELEINKLSLAVKNSPSPIIITDNNGFIEYVNPKFTHVTGYTESEAIGKTPRILKSGNTPFETYVDLWETITSGATWKGEMQNKRKNGSLYWEKTSISPIFDENKNITHFVAVKEDITEKKRIERLQDDTERILRHDLKNALNGIIGISQLFLVSEKVSEQDQSVWASAIYGSGMNMLHMINNSLDLFKMEEGKYMLKIEEINFIKLIEILDKEFAGLQESKSLLLLYEFNEELVRWDEYYPVVGEQVHIKTLFANLIKNAIEASPEGKKITININSRNPDYHEISIHNRGAIPESIRHSFFERYSTAGKKDGTGIGTYSAYLIAKTHGGDITFSTSEEEGTTITVLLPKNLQQENDFLIIR